MSEPIENGVKPLIDEPFYYSECDLPASEAFPEGWTACRPMLRVSLVHGDRSFSCGAIVDSGADYCCFPEWLMESLGIDKSLTKMEPNMHGSTGKIGNVYFYTVTIDLGFDKYPAYVCFHEGHPELAMLGQVGFFDRFSVGFNRAGKRFAITNRKFEESNGSLKGDNVP
jgi:hypothetical protein